VAATDLGAEGSRTAEIERTGGERRRYGWGRRGMERESGDMSFDLIHDMPEEE
jgi:hypothetical protein